MEGIQNENVVGNYLNFSKNCESCFDCTGTEDSKYCWDLKKLDAENSNSYDISFFGNGVIESYDSVELGYNTNRVYFSVANYTGVSNIFYGHHCMNNSQHLFGCVGLKHAEYCILNKQYTKEEYFELRDKIIEHMKQTGEWGEFFPIEMSPFAYNETVAQEYFPMTKEEVLARGWKWKDEESKNYQPQTYQIPNSITDVPDTICNEILACETCGKNYKIQKTELSFYRKMNLPIPRKCPECRHNERMKLRNPRTLFDRKCEKCGVDIQTTFAPERPELVYCEGCYLGEVN